MAAWQEVARGVYLRRYQPLDITVCVVQGRDGLLVVDTRASPDQAAELEADLHELGAPVRWVVNSHAHFDHTFGNQRFAAGSALDLPIYGHHLLPAHLEEYERPRLAAWRQGTGQEPYRDWERVVITPPTHLIHERSSLDLGGRAVELVPLAPGHTDNDLVVHVPDARTWIVGDVLEEPGPPMYGSGCFPLDWPGTLAQLLDEVALDAVVVPGHGKPVPRAFGVAQLARLRAVAASIEKWHAAGSSLEQALSAQDDWPFPVDGLGLALARGYAQLNACQ